MEQFRIVVTNIKRVHCHSLYCSSTQWTWVWVNSRSWWWTWRPGILQSMGSQRVGHNWATELNWSLLPTSPDISSQSFSWTFLPSVQASLVAQRLKCLPPMRETWVQSLGQEDPLEKEMATHSSIIAWRIPWMEKPGRLQSTGSQRVGHNWATSPSPPVQFSSVAQSCPTLCDPMNRSTPSLPVHHQLPEFTQTHIHRVQWCHPAITSSVVPSFSCPQSLPASESFPVNQLFA